MATYLVGNDGNITWPSTDWGDVYLNTWSAQFSRTISDITKFGDAAKRRIYGNLDIQGSAGGFIQRDAKQPGKTFLDGTNLDGVQLTLLSATGCSWQFDAVLTSFDLNVTKTGDQAVTFNFAASYNGNSLTYAWDES